MTAAAGAATECVVVFCAAFAVALVALLAMPELAADATDAAAVLEGTVFDAVAGLGANAGFAGVFTAAFAAGFVAVFGVEAATFGVVFVTALLAAVVATAAFLVAGLVALVVVFFAGAAFAAGLTAAFFAGAFTAGFLAAAFLAAAGAAFFAGAVFLLAGLLALDTALAAFFAGFFAATCQVPHDSLESGKRAVIPCRSDSGNHASISVAMCKSCDRTRPYRSIARLQTLDQPAAGSTLPFRPYLFGIRDDRYRSLRRLARQLVGAQTRRTLPSDASRWARPCTASPRHPVTLSLST